MNLRDGRGIDILADARCRDWDNMQQKFRRDAVIGSQVVEVKIETPVPVGPKRSILKSFLKSFLDAWVEHSHYLFHYRG